MSIKFIIFSKNRACQLHACIESLKNNFKCKEEPEITVLYKTTTDDFNNGYEKTKQTFLSSKITWEQETNFKQQVIKTVLKVEQDKQDFIMFLVDDIIFVNDFSLEDSQFSLVQNNSTILGLSLRLYEGTTYCYATNESQNVPKFVKKCIWQWQQQTGDWGYPMSVDGNVYRTEFIKPLIQNLDYTNPNTLEASLNFASKQQNFPAYLCCYPDAPKLINIPANRVQNTFQNRFEDEISAEELNNLYLSGNKIDIEHYKHIKPTSVHVPAKLEFTRE